MGDPGREKAGAGVVAVVVLVLALLVGGGYAAAYAGSTDKLPRGTTIAGVDVGGLTPQAAEQALREGLADRVHAPVPVVVRGTTTNIDPADAGFAVDYAASVAGAGAGRSWHPKRLWDYYTGGDEIDPVVTLDPAAFQAWADELAARVVTPAREGAVRFKGTEVVTTQPRDGVALDADATRTALRAAYASSLDRDVEPVQVPTVAEEPDIDAADVRRAVRSFANPAMSSGVTLRFGKAAIHLNPGQYADALSLEPEGGKLVPSLDVDALDALLRDRISGSGAPEPATVRLVKGKPRVVPDKPGVSYRPGDVAEVFLDLVARPSGKRTEQVPAKAARADFRTKDARALKIREKVSSFTTYYPYAEYRNTNIGRAAELVDGTVLQPGETFSLNDTVGKRTRRNGFTKGFVISNGIFAEELGGGVSQMATTTFNAMFFAGLEDVEHKPHSFYIDRYPVGREATVAWGSVDLRFRNDTPYGVLISAHVTPSTPSSQGVVTVDMWSTKYWDISTTTGDRYNLTEPKTRVLRTPDCYPNDGYGGFDIDVTRTFRKHGESAVDHTETFHTHYTPSDTVVCKPPKR